MTDREKAITTLTEHLDHWKRLLSEGICTKDEGERTIYALTMAIKALEQEPSKWIPISERLPEDHDVYVIVVKEKSTGYQYIPRIAIHNHDNCWSIIDTEDADKEWLDDLECIAWMPLPELYKAESEDKE